MKHQHSNDDAQHDHAHHHGAAAHQHLTAANLRPPVSLLAMSAWQRLALALLVLACLWGVVLWALQEVA
ncbi:hypothetical protein EAY64_17575 [Aquitalea palustris]|uniref:Uncharacterized protein n=1 Tax=Aquitalea palustris TaxID=2480983 RepID=A0A454JE77_9NEIS|nr:hypothetical protein [Aquitalea palustris]RMC92941.1 hypothetical protein EAY64_17575 [Aquitalea palustris]